jgi:hypothetical protein
MENAFRFSDNFGPARIISVYQPSLGLKAVLVVDNTACGTAEYAWLPTSLSRNAFGWRGR